MAQENVQHHPKLFNVTRLFKVTPVYGIFFFLGANSQKSVIVLKCTTEILIFHKMQQVRSHSVIKDVSLGIPKSDLLGVIVALIHVAAQRFLAV